MKILTATSNVSADAPYGVPGEAIPGAGPVENAVYVIMAGGGTGGHIYPGLAVLEQLANPLANLGRPVKIIWAATPRKIDQRLLRTFHYVPQIIRPLQPNPLRWPGFYMAWRQTCRYWRGFFAERKVVAVLALGGYAAGAVAYEAARRKIPVGLLNPDALVGRANRFLMDRAAVIFTQWPLDRKTGRHLVLRTQVVGCPVRQTMVRIPRITAATRLGLDPDRKTLVVTGASLGAQTINRAVTLLLYDPEIQQLLSAAGDSRWQILHLAGLEHAATLQARADRLTSIPWKVLDYCDDMAAVWSMADLAITRAGAGTCAELACMGVPAILMPYPFHKDRHQEANAEILGSAGAAVLVRDTKNDVRNAAELKSVLQRLLSESDRLTEMAMAAQSLAKPQAAQAVARWLLEQIQLQNGDQK
ncbi:MAG: UDP-N-acetylglucosamine--N-acetylmuramyl-(pentapeptide) pyrophosphoryl-undecaprenol N-acetylglucosamine transferase [Phycisphaerae bacterium]